MRPPTDEPNEAGPQPWNGAEQLAGPIRGAAEAAFVDAGTSAASMKAADVREWFDGVAGHAHSIQDRRNLVAINGVARLRAVARAGRFANHRGELAEPADPLLERRERGHASFRAELQRSFRGRATKRSATRAARCRRRTRLPVPTAADSRGCQTAEASICDSRMAAWCSRGPVPLVSVPLAGRPTEIYLQGELDLHRIQMFRSQPLEIPPDVLTDSRPIAAHLRDLGELSWRKVLPKKATFQDLPDGSVKLSADNVAEVAYAGTRLPNAGVSEVIVEVENASPGTGVYLGDDDGTPVFPVRFVLDQRTKRPAVHFLPIADGQTALGYDWNSMVVPFVGSRTWLRLLYGGAVLKCWVSVDGEHWGQVWAPWGQK